MVQMMNNTTEEDYMDSKNYQRLKETQNMLDQLLQMQEFNVYSTDLIKKNINYIYPMEREKKKKIRQSLDIDNLPGSKDQSPLSKKILMKEAVEEIMKQTSNTNSTKARVNHKWNKDPFKDFKIRSGSRKGMTNHVMNNIQMTKELSQINAIHRPKSGLNIST